MRRATLPLLLFLLLATALALQPGSPADPLDAMTGEKLPSPGQPSVSPSPRLPVVSLSLPWTVISLYPLTVFADLVAGAPAPPLAAAAFLIWATVLVGGSRFRRERRVFFARSLLSVLVSALAGALAAFLVLLAMVAFAALTPLPGWRLSSSDPALIAADLQSHTLASRDGLASAEENLRWHAARGYDVVAVTEHDLPLGSFAAAEAARLDPSLPAVLPGLEVRLKGPAGGYVVALGLSPHDPLTDDAPWPREPEEFFPLARERGAALVALADDLDPAGVKALAENDLDGFEVANLGHSLDPERTREAAREEVRARGLVPVAWTDWHGWGGACRTWTVFQVPGAAGMTRGQKAQAVLEVLRERKAGQVTAVTAGPVGIPSRWRIALTPVTEGWRYLRELTPVRLVGLWLWSLVALAAAAFLRRRDRKPLPALFSIYLAATGAGLLWRGGHLVLAGWGEGTTSLIASRTGGYALVLGLAALLLAVLSWRRSACD